MRKMTPLLTLLLVILSVTWAGAQEAPSAGQKLALYSKPAVVRVYGAYLGEFYFNNTSWRTSIGGVGSGFFINSDGYIATNAHVVNEIHDGEEKAREKLTIAVVKQIGNKFLGDYRRMTTDQYRVLIANLQLRQIKKFNFVQLTNGEYVPYEIKSYGAPVGEGKDCAIIKVELKNTPSLLIGDSNKVQLQDEVYALGYPGAVDNLTNLGVLDQKSQLEASITNGNISAKKNTTDGAPVLQVTVPITHGNSGGPAVNKAGEVIGLSTFGSLSSDGQEVQGFNFLVPSSTLMEFVRQAGTANSIGAVDRLYQEGLELYWQQRYTASIEKLQEVQGLFPAHSEAGKLIQQARDLKSQGKERSFVSSNLPLILGGSVVALLVIVIIGGTGAFLLLRKKPAPAAAFQPQPKMQYVPPTPQSVPQTPQFPPPSFQPAQRQPVQDPGKTVVTAASTNPASDSTVPIGQFSFGQVVCTRGLLQGQSFQITAQGINIGRVPGNQIVLPDGRASSKHAWIGMEEGKVVVTDNGSTNGTFLNSMQNRITRAALNDGDVVIISDPDVCSLTYKVRG